MSDAEVVFRNMDFALASIMNMIASLVSGVADAITQYASTIGQVVVISGVSLLAVNTLFKRMPLVRQVFGRILRP